MYCVFLRISAKVISTLAEKMPTLTLSVPSNPTHSLQHLLFETLQNCQHCTHKAKERERGEGLSKNKERMKKRFFNAKSFMGMHRVSVKDLLKNASWPMHMTQQGVKNVKKSFTIDWRHSEQRQK